MWHLTPALSDNVITNITHRLKKPRGVGCWMKPTVDKCYNLCRDAAIKNNHMLSVQASMPATFEATLDACKV